MTISAEQAIDTAQEAIRIAAEIQAANELAFLKALENMCDADRKSAKAVTPTMRLALLRSRSEKLNNGMPAFTKVTFKAALVDSYGCEPTKAGKAGKSLAATPRKHCQQFDGVFDVMFDDDFASIVDDFINHKTPTVQAASFSALLDAISAKSASLAKDKAKAAGVASAPAPASEPMLALPAPASVAERIADFKAYLAALSVDDVNANLSSLNELHVAIGGLWIDAADATERKAA